MGVQRTLVKLDLSWSKLRADQFTPLLKAICENKKLEYVSLAWIRLIKQSNFSEHGFESQPLSPRLRESPEKLKRKATLTQDQSVCESLVTLLTKNPKIVHVDFSETGLTQEIVRNLIKPIQSSQTLVGVHLSGNPGLTPSVE